jgi:hypothetical protein
MCCNENKQANKEWLAKNGDKEYVLVYKELSVVGNKLISPICHHIYKPGVNKSNFRGRLAVECKSEVGRYINRGLHAYTSRSKANKLSWGVKKPVVFRASPKDFIGKSRWGGDIVFKNLTLTKQAYEKAMGKK